MTAHPDDMQAWRAWLDGGGRDRVEAWRPAVPAPALSSSAWLALERTSVVPGARDTDIAAIGTSVDDVLARAMAPTIADLLDPERAASAFDTPAPDRRDPIAAYLDLRGFELVRVEGSPEALRLLAEHAPNRVEAPEFADDAPDLPEGVPALRVLRCLLTGLRDAPGAEDLARRMLRLAPAELVADEARWCREQDLERAAPTPVPDDPDPADRVLEHEERWRTWLAGGGDAVLREAAAIVADECPVVGDRVLYAVKHHDPCFPWDGEGETPLEAWRAAVDAELATLLRSPECLADGDPPATLEQVLEELRRWMGACGLVRLTGTAAALQAWRDSVGSAA